MAGLLTTIKDANGKEISVDMSKICDINGDVTSDSPTAATDSKKNRVAQVHDIEYVDSKGNAVDSMKILSDMQAGKVNVVALDLDIEATHSGPNHNYCIYYEDSMEKDAESFVNPFKKPILKNHNTYSGEPMGRIQQASHGPSALTDERSAINLKVRVTDRDSFEKFLDGRYSTVSISGTMGTVICNICGKTILKDGKFKFCGHWRGESYKDQVCYWGAKDIEYHEVSTVNNPADDFAQIMKVTVVTDEDNKNKEGSDGMDGQENKTAKDSSTKAADIKKSVCDMIDDLLGNDGKEDGKSTTADGKQNDDGATAADTKTDGADGTTSTGDDGKQQAQATDSNTEEVEKLKKDLEDAKAENEKLTKELGETKDALAKAEQDLKDSQNETKNMTDMCVALAASNKEMLADSIIEKEKAAGKLKDDTVEDRKKKLVAMSMKDLNKIAETASTEDGTKQRQTASVTNPGIVDRSGDNGKTKDGNGTADTNNKGTADNNKRRTVNDVANDIVGKLFK